LSTLSISTLSLHDALPIYVELSAILRCFFILAEPGDEAPILVVERGEAVEPLSVAIADLGQSVREQRDLLDLDAVFAAGRVVYADRKSTRLNSSHRTISYA